MNRSEHQTRIDKFMVLAGQELPHEPTEPSLEVRKLRASLILEETLEKIYKGLGVQVKVFFNGYYGDQCINLNGSSISFSFSEGCGFNMIETVDGCADLSVVTIGTLSAIGVDDLAILEEVDNNNLAKFGPGGKRRDDGKWEKPPGHKPPDIEGILAKQRKVINKDLDSEQYVLGGK